MKTYKIALIAAAILMAFACRKDTVNDLLQLDGENFTGPLLGAGFHETAVRFSPDITRPFTGKQLGAVLWYTGPRAANTEIRIYGPGAGSGPGALLYSKDVTSLARPFAWNEVELDAPVAITGEELWIGIAFVHIESGQTIGCDAGPNRPGGDWLFSTDAQWRTYTDRTGESVNWNIRGRAID